MLGYKLKRAGSNILYGMLIIAVAAATLWSAQLIVRKYANELFHWRTQSEQKQRTAFDPKIDTRPAPYALERLDMLRVRDRFNPIDMPEYKRVLYGPAWADMDHNGCDTRDDILARDLKSVVRKHHCQVIRGVLSDPYTGKVIAFTRGARTSTRVQIDHVVALSDAWRSGAYKLDTQTRAKLANDPDNLLAVDGPANIAKSDGNAAHWLPPNKAFRCTYAMLQVNVKLKYKLSVTRREYSALKTIMQHCK